jgi:hypothetical protein
MALLAHPPHKDTRGYKRRKIHREVESQEVVPEGSGCFIEGTEAHLRVADWHEEEEEEEEEDG